MDIIIISINITLSSSLSSLLFHMFKEGSSSMMLIFKGPSTEKVTKIKTLLKPKINLITVQYNRNY